MKRGIVVCCTEGNASSHYSWLSICIKKHEMRLVLEILLAFHCLDGSDGYRSLSLTLQRSRSES